jgi:hypothetical protein
MHRFTYLLFAIALVALSGCGIRSESGVSSEGVVPNQAPKPVSMSDTNLIPMLTAIAAVDRASLGFTPISPTAKILLETVDRENWKQEYPAPLYDAMLHIYGETERTISFKKTSDGYQWIGEQEIHYGPKSFTDANGSTYQEHLVIEYWTEPINGIPINQIHVSYIGEDSRLAGRHDLTLAEIEPILDSWKGTPIR